MVLSTLLPLIHRSAHPEPTLAIGTASFWVAWCLLGATVLVALNLRRAHKRDLVEAWLEAQGFEVAWNPKIEVRELAAESLGLLPRAWAGGWARLQGWSPDESDVRMFASRGHGEGAVGVIFHDFERGTVGLGRRTLGNVLPIIARRCVVTIRCEAVRTWCGPSRAISVLVDKSEKFFEWRVLESSNQCPDDSAFTSAEPQEPFLRWMRGTLCSPGRPMLVHLEGGRVLSVLDQPVSPDDVGMQIAIVEAMARELTHLMRAPTASTAPGG